MGDDTIEELLLIGAFIVIIVVFFIVGFSSKLPGLIGSMSTPMVESAAQSAGG